MTIKTNSYLLNNYYTQLSHYNKNFSWRSQFLLQVSI